LLLKKDTPNFSRRFILPAAGSALHIVEAIEGRRQKGIVLGRAKMKVDNRLETVAPYVTSDQIKNSVNTRS
jgi:hypothetical protein